MVYSGCALVILFIILKGLIFVRLEIGKRLELKENLLRSKMLKIIILR